MSRNTSELSLSQVFLLRHLAVLLLAIPPSLWYIEEAQRPAAPRFYEDPGTGKNGGES